jgi:hypothetical protein
MTGNVMAHEPYRLHNQPNMQSSPLPFPSPLSLFLPLLFLFLTLSLSPSPPSQYSLGDWSDRLPICRELDCRRHKPLDCTPESTAEMTLGHLQAYLYSAFVVAEVDDGAHRIPLDLRREQEVKQEVE